MNDKPDSTDNESHTMVIPYGALQRSPKDATMRLESDCESDFPHEIFARHQDAGTNGVGYDAADGDAQDGSATVARCRANVEKSWIGCVRDAP